MRARKRICAEAALCSVANERQAVNFVQLIMKILFLVWLAFASTSAGEISERYFKDREAFVKRMEAETNSTVKSKMLEELAKPHLANGRGFQFFTNNGVSEVANGNIVVNHGVTEIGIERTGCFGTCPAYTFVITSTGKCRYEGGAHAKIEGKKTGSVSMVQFHRLAEFLRDLQFFALKDEYSASITDAASTFTTAVIGGKRKTIHDYAGLGPARLWAIEQLLDGMLTEVRWD